MKRIFTWAAAILCALALAFLALFAFYPTPALSLEKLTDAPQSAHVFAADGTEYGTLPSAENRTRVELSALPDHVWQAFVAAEDRRFFEHSGVDPVRMLGALAANLKSRSFSQGASTITQQLIKNTHLTGEKKLSRKIQEIRLALELERKWNKMQILEAYLNVVYFGSGAYGIEAAAREYFRKPASELTLSEAALLAAAVKAPGYYAPDGDTEKVLERQKYVLDGMEEMGYITAGEKRDALAAELPDLPDEPGESGWYLDLAYAEAAEILSLSLDEVASGGYRIHTALQPACQAQVDALFADPENFPAGDGDTQVEAALVLMDPETGGILAIAGGRNQSARLGFNRATDMRRSPGSALKPIAVYSAAIERLRLLPSSFVDDSERDFGGYIPRNAGGQYHGTVTLREALAHSYNAAAVSLAERVGMRTVREMAERAGIPLSDGDAGLSLALGSMTSGVTPAELAASYSALANGGMQVVPHAVTRIEDRDGSLLYQHIPPQRRVMRQETAYLLTDMLKTAASSGTARALSGSADFIAGKTGTSTGPGGEVRDLWIAGYTPDAAAVVWMGYDEPGAHRLPDHLGGGGYPARLLAKLFSKTDSGDRDFPRPASLTTRTIDTWTLQQDHLVRLAAPETPPDWTIEELFYVDDPPVLSSDAWNPPPAPENLTAQEEDGGTLLRFQGIPGVCYRIWRDGTEIGCITPAEAGEVLFRDEATGGSYTVTPENTPVQDPDCAIPGPSAGPVRAESGLERLFGSLF